MTLREHLAPSMLGLIEKYVGCVFYPETSRKTWVTLVDRGLDFPCGTWVRAVNATTIQVGSDVEDTDMEVVKELSWPFTREKFLESLNEVEEAATAAWHRMDELRHGME